MKPKTKRGERKLPSDTKLFRFTEEDEARMIIAIESSKRFMKSYSKGRGPSGLIADYRKYSI